MAPGRPAPPSRLERWLGQIVDRMTSNANYAVIFYLQIGMIRLFDFIMQILGPILIFCGSSLILIAAFLFLSYVLPSFAPPGTLTRHLHLVVSVYLLCNVMFNYFMCASTKPGRPARLRSMPALPDEEEGNGGSSAGASLQQVPTSRSRSNAPARGIKTDHGIPGRFVVLWRYCDHCKRPKPPRTHHCSVCKECVLNMDHHCPWMNNCIGYHNYRYFFLFLAYLWIGCAYVIACTTKSFADYYRREGKRALQIRATLDRRTATIFCFMMAFSVCIALSFLWGWHIYLTLSAQSTVEFYINRDRKAYARSRGRLWQNPFDLGPWRNWEQIFGPGNPLLAVQISWRDPPPPLTPFCPTTCGDDYESEARIV